MRELPGHCRHAFRILKRTPVFTATAIASLAIGIGANSAIFSAGNALIFAPTPGIQDMARLVDIGRSTRGSGFDTVSYPTFADLREGADVFSGVYAMRLGPEPMSLGTAEGGQRIWAEQVSGGYFDVLGVAPAVGTVFHAAEERPDVPLRKVVLRHAFWRRQFSADAAVVGRPIVLNGDEFTIAGVAPERFEGTTVLTPDLWVPLTAFARGMPRPEMLRQRTAQWLIMGARLKAGVSIERARHATAAFGQQLASQYPDVYRDRGLAVVAASRVPGHAMAYGAPLLGLLLGLTGLVLLVACTNLAGLLLARSTARAREIAIRLAIGASRRSIFGLLMAESIVLALAGGAAGLVLAVWSRRAIASLTALLPVPATLMVPVDWRLLAFTAGLTALTALLAGAVPAWQCTRPGLVADLKADSTSPRHRRTRHLFVGAQVAFCAVLVALAGLFVRAVSTAAAVDPGLNVDGIDVVVLNLDLAGYSNGDRPRVAEEIRERLGALPGVRSASIGRLIPLEGSRIGLGQLRRPGDTTPAGRIRADWNSVSPDYLSTMDIPMQRGRPFSPADRSGASDVAIVNERFAATVWPDLDPIGRTVDMGDFTPGQEATVRTLTVVGVARDSKSQWIGEVTGPFIYVPFAQHSSSEVNYFVRRAEGLIDGAALDGAIRDAVRDYNRNLPVIRISPLALHAGLGLLPQRAAAAVAGTLGLIALLLAAIGVHGVVAHTVVSRTRELGVRVALGADARRIVWTILRQSLVVVSFGAAIGLAASAGAGHLARGLLFGVSPLDPVAFAGAAIVLGAVAVLACFVPARRATRINPVVALRSE
jgi:predicted permease